MMSSIAAQTISKVPIIVILEPPSIIGKMIVTPRFISIRFVLDMLLLVKNSIFSGSITNFIIIGCSISEELYRMPLLYLIFVWLKPKCKEKRDYFVLNNGHTKLYLGRNCVLLFPIANRMRKEKKIVQRH